MNISYSQFFTSGLYASDCGPRRGSLPTDSLSPSSPPRTGSSFYFTLQPTRDEKEYRSFLSLDLAESKPTHLAPPSPKTSRLSLSARKVPSPKPAPSTSLPDLPSPKLASPTPVPPSPKTTAATRTPTPPTTVPQKRVAPSAPARTSKKHTRSSTLSTVSTRTRRVNRSVALDRLEGRALGRSPPTTWLGKALASAPPSVTTFRSNFMSLSDDEDSSSEDDVDSIGARSDYSSDEDDMFSFGSNRSARGENRAFYGAWLEEEDSVLPVVSPSMTPCRERSEWISRSSLASTSTVPLSTSPLSMSVTTTSIDASPSGRTRIATASRNRSGSTRVAEWFPLKSFIDLRSTTSTDSHSLDTASLAPSTTSAAGSSPSLLSTRMSTMSLGPLPLNPFAFEMDMGEVSPKVESPGSEGGGWRWRSFIDVGGL